MIVPPDSYAERCLYCGSYRVVWVKRIAKSKSIWRCKVCKKEFELER